ncbi:hypothetical protein SAMN05192529_105117 [Arachidicoccus rhizosphaerae]|uniref:Uncharacterized protein n=1 Tax=Arachidicoccus rhizosphaerae TaxID=551991 RepID=A0A1H3XEG5_9BACT|nr:hypothetical protein [Arachidicoccus rhizosphaerae]SDZ97723.1 hypothetical protein SAMN05192529_105117 [Arachidicoccus rhizosphaerae]
MVSLFKEKTSIGVFRLMLLSVVVHAKFFIHSPQVVVSTDNMLLAPLLKYIIDWPTLVLAMIYHALIVIQALRLNYILGNHKLFAHTNFTVAMCYILFTGLLPQWCVISEALVINILIIWLIHLLCQLYHTAKAGAVVFNIGLVTGIAILLYPPAYPLILIMLIGIMIIRPFKFTQLITYIIGTALPLYFLGAYLYFFDQFSHVQLYLPRLGLYKLDLSQKGTLIGCFSLILICVIGGFSYLQANMHKLLILARKCWIILFLMVLFFIPAPFTLAGAGWAAALLLMPAAAAIAGNLFYYNQQKVILAVLFWLLIFSAWFYSFNGWALLPKT